MDPPANEGLVILPDQPKMESQAEVCAFAFNLGTTFYTISFKCVLALLTTDTTGQRK